MTPGSVAMLLGETTGLRLQTAAPSLGATTVRIQGLRGRYAQILADGLPLYSGDSFSLLQAPPLDLGQVEIIKGAASALYGPSALGGVVNLVARRPRVDEREALFNLTSQGGTDTTFWLAEIRNAAGPGPSSAAGIARAVAISTRTAGRISAAMTASWSGRACSSRTGKAPRCSSPARSSARIAKAARSRTPCRRRDGRFPSGSRPGAAISARSGVGSSATWSSRRVGLGRGCSRTASSAGFASSGCVARCSAKDR